MRRFWVIILLVLVAVVLLGVGVWALMPFLADYWWFRDLGAESLLWRRFAWYGLWVFGIFWLPLVGLEVWFGVVRRRWQKPLVWTAVVLGVVSAGFMWVFRDVTLAWLTPVAGMRENLLHRDAMWYVVWLPFWRFVFLYGLGYSAVVWVLDRFLVSFPDKRRDWGNFFLIVVMVVLGVGVAMLFSFELFVWQPNARLGMGFSDFYGTLLAWWIVVGIGMGLVLLWGVLFFLGRLRFFPWLVQTLVAGVLAVLIFFVWPWGLALFYEKPNELHAQRRFIEARRMATREAFGLRYEVFAFSPDLNSLASVRLWDTAPYLQNIRQLQTMRNYFDFLDVDVGFYMLSNRIQQVLIACRELVVANLPAEAKSWENLHLRYTHGLGVVVSPANQATPEGQPIFWVRNLSQESDLSEFALRRPQIYFGEADLPYALVRTEVAEFSYTDATNRVETVYHGTNGVRLLPFGRFVFARAFQEKNIALTRYFTPESGVLWERQIIARLRKLVPDLLYDPDPYPVIVNGEIYWIVDAYTATDRYPLSKHYDSQWGRINAIRHSVKVVISAYTGDVRFYVIDPSDPLLGPIRFFARDLFTEEIPEEIKAHFRYPHALLALQAEVFGLFHTDSNESFYNGDDIWTVPLVRQGDTNILYEPFYVLLEAGGRDIPGVFVPFTPLQRQNLSGWLFGTYENGLRLYRYVAPRTKSIPGPSQIEAKIHQNEELAKLFTLWGQREAKVSLGITRYIPLGDDVVAVVPLYISSQFNATPQMTLVIAIYKNRVFYAKNTGELISMIQKSISPVTEVQE